MNLKTLSLPLLLLTFSTFAQDAPPVVAAITPAAAPSSGGTEITFTGTNLAPTIVCALPCPTTVTFGTITVPVDEAKQSAEQFVVTTPAHTPATVDVIVEVPGREPLRMPGAFTFLSRPEDEYAKVLVPVFIDGFVDGAFGSRWTTSLWMRNAGSEAVQLAPWPCTGEVCPPVFPLTYVLHPGDMRHNLPEAYSPDPVVPARLLYVSRTGADQVHFGLRVVDVSRARENAGTEIPVIGEDDLATAPVDLYEIPMKTGFRTLLRVYETSYASSEFTVNVYPMTFATVAPLHSFSLTSFTADSGEFRTEPAYAQFDLTSLMELDDVNLPESVRVEVVPQRPGSRFWAFIAITNNATQLVTTATPQ